MRSPIALLIFNRPAQTERVFQAIRQARPSKLLVVADGPRANRPGEAEKCAATRAVIDRVDWDCEVIRHFSDTNLGCKTCVAEGLDWIFTQVEEAIILEDDCIPHPSFFRYCDELLETYRDDDRVATICGTNLQFGRSRTPYSYYFSTFHSAWGWATWRRAWQKVDYSMDLWPEVRDSRLLQHILLDRRAVDCWHNLLQKTYEGQIDTWDYRFTLSCWLRNQLHIVPDINLVSNIGFGQEATHTFASPEQSLYAQMPALEMAFPLRHPPYLVRQVEADSYTQNTFYHPSFFTRAQTKLQRMVRNVGRRLFPDRGTRLSPQEI